MAIKTLGKQYRNESEAINALRSELSKLEEQQSKQEEVLQKLRKEAGFSNVDELIYALAEIASPSLRTKLLGKGARAKKKVARKKKAAAPKKKSARKKKTATRKASAKKATKKATKKAAKKVAKKAARKGKRKRALLTDETVSQMKEAFTSSLTGPEIAKKFGVSESTVHNVKKRLGMTKG